ncbi:MAG: hypothetical protein AAFX87_25225 [Bacteroidota bacterium]
MKRVFVLVIATAPMVVYAQETPPISIEELKQVDLMKELDKAVILMDEQHDYEAADVKYRKVLKGVKVVPANLCFYFGKNSYYLNKYEQSIDWLSKYIELKGTVGQFYEECTRLLELAQNKYLGQRREEIAEVESILASDFQIDCGPTGKVICPVCQGQGVIISTNSFGQRSYQSCPYSDEHGHLTCEEYNLLLKGELKPKF